MKRFIVFILFLALQFAAINAVDFAASMPVAKAGVSQLNGGDSEALAMRAVAGIPSMVLGLMVIINAVMSIALFKKERKKMKGKLKTFVGAVLVGVLAMTTGCKKPYDTPEFVEIQPNETAFVIQADGDSSNQDMFKSEDFLQKNMVAAKRIQIPHRWVQTGRKYWQGHYIDTVFVYRVNRAPVTRELVASTAGGTSSRNQALTAESKDSLFVSSGFTMTAYIEPHNAAKFLYKYQGKPLANVVDQQVRNSVQAVFATECAKYNLIDLPNHKADIIAKVRESVIPFYSEWGITLANDMGFVGGLVYSNEIQAEIDSVFKSEKAKERAIADKLAQDETNKKLLAMAENEAAMKKVAADAEAYAVMKKAEAINAAGQNYIAAEYIKKWDGVEPKVKGADSSTLLNIGGIN